MIEKKEIPILEFDEDKDAIISPFDLARHKKTLPNKLIITFFKDVLNRLVQEGKIFEYDTITGENDLVIYKFKDTDIIIIHGMIGGSATGGFLDGLIGLGVTEVMFCGGGGVLNKDITVGKFIIVDGAIRDEGFSYHYVKPSRIIETDKLVKKKICDYLDSQNIPYLVGLTWTTDAFYRETKAKIKLRKEEGAIVVEMEQAGLIAVTKYRNVNYGAIIYGGDDVSGIEWDKREWHTRSDIRYALFNICKEILEDK